MPPASALPVSAGIGLRTPHVARVRTERPCLGWLEVHSENYFVDGGPAIAALEAIRRDYPISLHGVGLSLGSADALDAGHLTRLKQLVSRIEPGAVSEHLCWSHVDGRHLNDLLPLPFTEEALDARLRARRRRAKPRSAERSWSRTFPPMFASKTTR